MQKVRISSKGQLTIPSKIRDAFGISKGDEFLIKKSAKSIVIEPIKYRSLNQLFSDVKSRSYVSDNDIKRIKKRRFSKDTT